MSTIHLHQTTTLTPSSTSPALPTSGLAARRSLATALTSTSRCIAAAPPKPTSPKARAVIGNACTTTGPIGTMCSQDDRLQHVGRRVRAHLQLHPPPRRFDRHRRGYRTRRQDPQRMVPRVGARDHRPRGFEEGVCKFRQGHRSPERRGEAGTRIMTGGFSPQFSPAHTGQVLEQYIRRKNGNRERNQE